MCIAPLVAEVCLRIPTTATSRKNRECKWVLSN